MYDLLIVGCGLFGATFARKALDAGKTVLIIDQRKHIGGNCYTEEKHGILVHKYGPHQFHTRDRGIWDFVTKYAEFNHYRAHIVADAGDGLYSMPPNMRLFNQLWGVKTPAEAKQKVESVRISCDRPRNVKDFILDALGPEVYEKFYEGYSTKQWGVDPSEIPISVGKRLPIRFNWTDRWFEDEYEGIPKKGYTHLIENLIDGADVVLNTNFKDIDFLSNPQCVKKVVYTGKIDELFDYQFGELEYRTLRFEEEVHDGDYQGNAIINYTSKETPWTRIVEHKHFAFQKSDKTVITKEFSSAATRNDVPYYPVDNEKNRLIYARYAEKAKETNFLLGGRLASFKYMDMDTTVGQALKMAETVTG
jgi:UDP-galactopyranose mutase